MTEVLFFSRFLSGLHFGTSACSKGFSRFIPTKKDESAKITDPSFLNCERQLNTSRQMVILAFLVLLLKRF
ncbi:hypothetical protein HZL39_15020 (plasmid) [Lactiplantibacillus plantarum]|nr:hypothetical protein HZL39_15020 [Lactiplantibacillus plantarum]